MRILLARPDIDEREIQSVTNVLRSGVLSLGPRTAEFEARFARRFGRAYGVALNSGTSALHVAVKALGLGPGDEVITTPYSFIASGNCLLYEGVRPVFVDINPETLTLDAAQVEAAITPRTRGILPVHLFGQVCEMDVIREIADRHHLKMIEDACEAIGATWKGKPAGTWGEAAVFGFYPNKQITTGEGGMLLTDDPGLRDLALSLRNQGRDPGSQWLQHDRVGYNYRMSELQAALGLVQLERLEEILARRADVAKRYIQLLRHYRVPVDLPRIPEACQISWFVFIVILPQGIQRERVIHHLGSNGIQSRAYFPVIHLQHDFYSRFDFRPGNFPVSETMAERTLAIPFFNQITPKEQEKVIGELAIALKKEGFDANR
ncbi:DegT/DnrJ/EryC1/StrS family aminotransferase [Desmospora profundinema]|uniref:Perosamine synthetase n=1 Tax=Desmospora profundinema TaxID=1571184 RepID=A0ABU1IRY3_9BACL|nr:DegT/DnrJ/EryC1/StrS family aminotransferase [Desmospora profundinema]MDR6227505.1 perosamine synthetase [Desmospora profundinema]